MEKGVEEWCVSEQNNLEGCGREMGGSTARKAGPADGEDGRRRGRRTVGTEYGGDRRTRGRKGSKGSAKGLLHL